MTTDATLAAIRAEYAPYDTFPEFEEGFAAHATRRWSNPHNPDSVAAQAWDRGLEAASRYARALDPAQRGAVVETMRRPTKTSSAGEPGGGWLDWLCGKGGR